MRLQSTKDKLHWAISLADRVTSRTASLAALGHVFLAANDNTLTVRATNLEVSLELSMPVVVVEEGSLLVPGAVVANFLANAGAEDKIEVATQNQNLLLSAKGAKSVIKTFPSDDFPTFSRLESKKNKLSVDARELVSGLRSVIYAAATSDIKPEIASVYLYQDSGDGYIYCVATDAFRLAEKKVAYVKGVEDGAGELKIIIPGRNVAEIMKVLDGMSGVLELAWDAHQVAFSGEGVYVASRLVDGVFPDYRQIMPSSAQTVAVVLKSDLVSALRLTQIFSDKLNQVALTINPTANSFEITSHNDIGENVSRLEATLQGEEVSISFNIRYLLECLGSVASDSISLKFNAKHKPILVSGVGDNSFHYLIMPLNR